jgi:hypothetical protein
MKTVSVQFVGIAPYSQSRKHDTPKLDKESPDALDLRTWREKSNYDAKTGEIFIPAMAFKQALDAAAKRLGDQIPGKGKSTYTKFFVSDVICNAHVPLGIHKDAVPSVTLNCNSDGVRGSGKRVPRIFPVIESWGGIAEFTVYDDTITEDVFKRTFEAAGRSIGLGRFRPENGGLNGRFVAKSFKFAKV